ncbi:MAG: beta-lactamase family protein [Planctomycetes bacterium]|nr:beta-lactamase family protein [Planctomycetota bacterium]
MQMRYLNSCCVAVVLILACLPRLSSAVDFSALTTLAEGALVGENVDTAVPGFEIRLLQNGTTLYHQAFGDWLLDRPARVDSSTKTLAGALMMSLAETGESGFSLDSRLSDFLNEYDTPTFRDITVRQAFSHTGGFEGQGATSLILANKNISLRQAAQWISFKPLTNGPQGSTFAYGGLSMQVAGAAAEVATGKRFVDLFANRMTTPLGMTSTQFVAASQDNPRVAGGVESTATDYARFMDMLLNDGVDRATGTRVLNADSVAEMLTRQTNDAQPIANSPTGNNRYGIGVWLDQYDQAAPAVDVLAAGARGFHSWIDDSQGLVFTFATDLTTSSNLELLSSKMHAAILQTLVPGDFNFEGEVNGDDFLLWQRGGSPDPLSSEDLATWEANYGNPASSATQAVPEPSASVLILGGIMAVLCAAGAVRRNVRNRFAI